MFIFPPDWGNVQEGSCCHSWKPCPRKEASQRSQEEEVRNLICSCNGWRISRRTIYLKVLHPFTTSTDDLLLWSLHSLSHSFIRSANSYFVFVTLGGTGPSCHWPREKTVLPRKRPVSSELKNKRMLNKIYTVLMSLSQINFFKWVSLLVWIRQEFRLIYGTVDEQEWFGHVRKGDGGFLLMTTFSSVRNFIM